MLETNFLLENNARYNWHPMGHPAESINNPPVIIVGGEGVCIRDLSGNEVIDAVGGLWNVNLGYSCEPIKKAISQQLAELPYYSSFRGSSNDKIIELAYMLKEFFAPEGMTRAFYTSGGSDSVETALRLARQYHRIRGEGERTKFLSLKLGYHGTHFGGASVNGNYRFRQLYEPMLPGCHHLPVPHVYRNDFDEDDPDRLVELCLNSLKAEIGFQGAGTIAAFIMEPVMGAGGLIVPPPGYCRSAREICASQGILFIADEVITGFGRTGEWSGSRLWGIKPDMMTLAKAITSGYFPFGATMVSETVADVFESASESSGFIGHGYTYSGHPVGAAAAIACLEETLRLSVKDNAAERGKQLFAGLVDLANRYDIIGDVRGGHGLMAGIELVSDRDRKTPADKEIVEKIHARIYDSGLMVRISGNNLLLSPPLVINREEIETVLSAIETGLSIA